MAHCSACQIQCPGRSIEELFLVPSPPSSPCSCRVPIDQVLRLQEQQGDAGGAGLGVEAGLEAGRLGSLPRRPRVLARVTAEQAGAAE